MHKRMGQWDCAVGAKYYVPRSAQILIMIGKVFAMHVNARTSNHNPNFSWLTEEEQVLCRDVSGS